MYELVWIAVGIAVGLAATQLLRLYRESQADAAAQAGVAAVENVDGEANTAPNPIASPTAAAPTAPDAPPRIAPEARRMALSLAEELADLITAVEGRTYHLIEAAPTRALLPAAAEATIAAVKRLRTLHTKLVAFGQGRAIEPGSTDVVRLIEGLGGELQHLQLGLELHWDLPPDLPQIRAHHKAVRDALLFLCAALLRAERGATRLNCVAERGFHDDGPTIDIELSLEWIIGSPRSTPELLGDDTFTLDLEAAHHLITTSGGELMTDHLPGKSVRAVVSLPMVVALAEEHAVAEEAVEPPPPPPIEAAALVAEVELAVAAIDTATATAATARPTATAPSEPVPGPRFGGALVLESDPALREVLARELKASGRAVFACADGAAAHTFLEATPDRFELLIVDDAQELAGDRPLALTIRTLAPSLKICLLTPSPAAESRWPGLHCLKKPFGVHELRRTLASILDAG